LGTWRGIKSGGRGGKGIDNGVRKREVEARRKRAKPRTNQGEGGPERRLSTYRLKNRGETHKSCNIEEEGGSRLKMASSSRGEGDQ